MSPRPSFFAPGKLLIAGEYAVLDGHPAVIAAVSRGVTLRAAPDADRAASDADRAAPDDLLYHAPPHTPAPLRLIIDAEARVARPRHPLAPGPARAAALACHVIAEVLRDPALDPHRLRGQRLDADLSETLIRDPLGATVKLGLGSSAASCVALTRAIAALAGHPDLTPQQTTRRALRAHRAFQDGHGSGADVAASAFGGLTRFSLTDDPAAPRCARLPTAGLPPWRAFWIGQPASTVDMIGRVARLRATAPRRHARCISALAEAARQVEAALRAADPAAALLGLAAASAAMSALGDAADAPIITPAHRALAARARDLGLVCKPSGAGGGDLSLVFGPDADALDALTPRALDAGLLPLDLHLAR